MKLRQIADVDSPTYVTAPPGDHKRLFITQQDGLVRVMKKGRLIGKPFLDLTGVTEESGERGLLSIAFHPDYKKNRRLYAYYTDQQSGDIRVDGFKRSAKDPERAAFKSRDPIFSVPHRDNANHNGGQLQFGPDGLLYAGTGDGGGSYDLDNNAQNPGSNLGKLLRLDPLAGGAPEQFAIGLRNPYRFSFDRLSGALTIGDVGQNEREEVNYGPLADLKGANFGWKCREGTIATPDQGDADLPCTPAGKRVDPIFDYSHSRGCSITGGYVVRDRRLGGLFGRYIYGDFCDPVVRSIEVPSGRDDQPTGLRVDSLSSFGEDAGGCVYTTSLDGSVSKIVPDSGGSKKPC